MERKVLLICAGGHVNRDSDEENGKVCRGQRH